MRSTRAEQEQRKLERKVKEFNRIVMSKELLSFEQDAAGFAVLTYKNGQTFKCRGPIAEGAGLLS